jgi:hypothetical protein
VEQLPLTTDGPLDPLVLEQLDRLAPLEAHITTPPILMVGP